jgi:hypothetical protein
MPDTTPPEPSAPPVSYTAAEQECLSSTNLGQTAKYYNVVSCIPIGFDVTVYPGQRILLKDPNGGTSGSHPWIHIAGYGETGST